MNAEDKRLKEAWNEKIPWYRWGPYLSERQWGTVREDYSEDGNAWEYFTHDHARSRAYHWGEDGLAGISDDKQLLCFALALWNGKDPIVKERLFGLTNGEGNHGEDVKEYYFYLDNTPTHSYMKYLYKYPHNAYPYDNLLQTNRKRDRKAFEYELIDTGVFDQERYFDVFVEYAKESPENLLIQISAFNRGPVPAELHVLPTLWFRNVWSWQPKIEKPRLRRVGDAIHAVHPELGEHYLHCEGGVPLLFTENETNTRRIFGVPNASPYVKDGINDYLVRGLPDAINPEQTGTKAAAHYRVTIPPGGSQVIRLFLTDRAPHATSSGKVRNSSPFGTGFAQMLKLRQEEADEFYKSVLPAAFNADETNVARQALAGMLWNKQYYNYDLDQWLRERGAGPFKLTHKISPRNEQWHHMCNGDVISMPDKWEYPWYAAWDLAFHVLALSLVDIRFSKEQLQMMLRERYIHPNGQLPAYEWNFSDVNPPVHAWSTIFLYRLDKLKNGKGDIKWLKSCFRKLLLNFTWWVNREDRMGRNVFEGGFLGLDNIGVFDRSSPLPTGGFLEQADGTAWMALFADNMLEIAIELAMVDDDYEDMALKFLQHDSWITSSLIQMDGTISMWDEVDGFFYDVLRLPNGESKRLKIRSMVGLLPFCAATPFEPEVFEKFPQMTERFNWFLDVRPEMCTSFHDPRKPGVKGRRLFAVLDEEKLRRVLKIMLDENEFLSPYGIRSLSRYHYEHPYVFRVDGQEHCVPYQAAESDSSMFGGNSNWRGPIWLPVNVMILRALRGYYAYYGNSVMVECPTGSGRLMNLYQVAEEIAGRIVKIFLKDQNGRRPVYGGTKKFQEDPHWRDLILFYEYFHGDNGAGLGANHQTGWTGAITSVMHIFATTTAEQVRELGQTAAIVETPSPWAEKLGATDPGKVKARA